MNQNNFNSIFPIVEYGFPIQRSFKSDGEKVSFYYPEYAFTRSQDLEKCYHDAGQFYWINTNKLLEHKEILTTDSFGLVIPSTYAQDIDCINDWMLAEIKFDHIKKNINEN